MIETWVVFVIIGLWLASSAALGIGWYRSAHKVAPPEIVAEKRVARARQFMDEFEGVQNMHLHRNRDGSVAIALGQPPEVWPEDMAGIE